MFPKFSLSSAYQAKYSGVGFGLTLISGCRNHDNPEGFDLHKRKLLRKMRKRQTLAEITSRIDTYAGFFQHFGFDCPLTHHLKRTIHSGFPRYDLIVDAHFMAEMCAGILVAVTDYERFDGRLTLDVAAAGEVPAEVVSQGRGNIQYQRGELETGVGEEAQVAGEARGEAEGLKVEKVESGKQKVGRNDPCPCGSGKKFKKCCGSVG